MRASSPDLALKPGNLVPPHISLELFKLLFLLWSLGWLRASESVLRPFKGCLGPTQLLSIICGCEASPFCVSTYPIRSTWLLLFILSYNSSVHLVFRWFSKVFVLLHNFDQKSMMRVFFRHDQDIDDYITFFFKFERKTKIFFWVLFYQNNQRKGRHCQLGYCYVLSITIGYAQIHRLKF